MELAIALKTVAALLDALGALLFVIWMGIIIYIAIRQRIENKQFNVKSEKVLKEAQASLVKLLNSGEKLMDGKEPWEEYP